MTKGNADRDAPRPRRKRPSRRSAVEADVEQQASNDASSGEDAPMEVSFGDSERSARSNDHAVSLQRSKNVKASKKARKQFFGIREGPQRRVALDSSVLKSLASLEETQGDESDTAGVEPQDTTIDPVLESQKPKRRDLGPSLSVQRLGTQSSRLTSGKDAVIAEALLRGSGTRTTS